jgi:Zn-dependent protease with chaperone function
MSGLLVALGSAWLAWFWPWLIEGTVLTAVLLPLLRWPRLSPALRSAVALLAVGALLVPWSWRPGLPWRIPVPPGDGPLLSGNGEAGVLLGVVALLHGLGVVAALGIAVRRHQALRILRLHGGQSVPAAIPGADRDAETEAALNADLGDLAERVGLRTAPSLRVTARVAVPCVVGWMRPIVALPPGVIERLARPELRALLGHELLHLRHRDPWRAALRTLAASLWWFHPLVRRLVRDAAEVDELRCDDSVLALGLAAPGPYRDALLEVAELASRDTAHLATVAATGAHRLPLCLRLRRLCLTGVARRTRLTAGEWVAAGLLAAVVSTRAALPVESSAPTQARPSAPASLGIRPFARPLPPTRLPDHAALHRARHRHSHPHAMTH